MKKAKTPSRSSKRFKEDPTDYHQRIQNYKQDIDKIKTQVSQLQQKLDEQTDYDSSLDLTDDYFQDKYPTKRPKNIDTLPREQNIRRGRETKKKNRVEAQEDEEIKNIPANGKTKNSHTRSRSPITSTDHQKDKQKSDRKIDIETPSIENYNQILTDNKVLAHKIKNLLASNSNLDEENKSLKEANNSLNQKNHDLSEQLSNAKTKLAKLEKAHKELKNNQQNTNKKHTKTRAKSVTKIPVMIDPDQIKEKVNSRDVDIDKLLSFGDETSSLNKKNEELKVNSEQINLLEKENKKLKEKCNHLTKEFQSKIDTLTSKNKELKDQLENSSKQLTETPSTKKLRIADSETIADLTDKIALLEEENMRLRMETLSVNSVNVENRDLKNQLNKKQRSRPTDNEAIASLTEKIADLNQENMNLKKSLISCQSLRTENDELKEKIEKLQNSNPIESKPTSSSNLIDDLSENELKAKVESLTKENNQLKSATIAHKSLERENAKLQNKYNSLVEAIQHIKPDQAPKKQIEKLKSTVENLSKENNNSKPNSSSSDIKSRSIEFNGDDIENEIKKLNEELIASKAAIDKMEKEFNLQKKDLKDNYDLLLKEIREDTQNSPSIKEEQLNKKVKSLEQELGDQKLLYTSLKNVNSKLQDQINQSRANNLVLIKQIEDMNKQIEQLSTNTSSIQLSDDVKSQDQSDPYKEKEIKNFEYDQIKKDFVQIHKSLADVPDSSDSYSPKSNSHKLNNNQNRLKISSLSHSKGNSNENDIEKHPEESNQKSPTKKSKNSPPNKSKNSPTNKSKNSPTNKNVSKEEETKPNSSDKVEKYSFKLLSQDNDIDNFLNENKIDILSDNDTENEDANELLNDNFTESDNSNNNNNNYENKNIILSDSDNKDDILNKNNKNKTVKKRMSSDNSIDIDNLLNTSGTDFDGFSTSEAFRQIVDSLGQNRGEFSFNTEEEFEKLKASMSIDDSSSTSENAKKGKDKSPKKSKKTDYVLLEEDLDEKTFSD